MLVSVRPFEITSQRYIKVNSHPQRWPIRWTTIALYGLHLYQIGIFRESEYTTFSSCTPHFHSHFTTQELSSHWESVHGLPVRTSSEHTQIGRNLPKSRVYFCCFMKFDDNNNSEQEKKHFLFWHVPLCAVPSFSFYCQPMKNFRDILANHHEQGNATHKYRHHIEYQFRVFCINFFFSLLVFGLFTHNTFRCMEYKSDLYFSLASCPYLIHSCRRSLAVAVYIFNNLYLIFLFWLTFIYFFSALCTTDLFSPHFFSLRIYFSLSILYARDLLVSVLWYDVVF